MKTCGQIIESIAARVSDAVSPNEERQIMSQNLNFSLENEVIRTIYTPYNLKFPFEFLMMQVDSHMRKGMRGY